MEWCLVATGSSVKARTDFVQVSGQKYFRVSRL